MTNVVLANAVTAAVSTAIWSTHPSRPYVKATFAISRFKRRLRRPPHEGYHPAQIDPEKSASGLSSSASEPLCFPLSTAVVTETSMV